jgi:hypothetical protein
VVELGGGTCSLSWPPAFGVGSTGTAAPYPRQQRRRDLLRWSTSPRSRNRASGACSAGSGPNPRPERRPWTRGEVLEAVRAAGADGATPAELLETLGVKGDPPGEKAVSNALSSLKKSGALLHEGNRYMVA